MRQSQRGMTFIGWLIMIVPLAIVVYSGIRVAPMYLNYMRVASSLKELAQDANTDGSTTAGQLRSSLGRRFDVNSIDHPGINDIDIHRDGDHWVAIADYQDTAPLFGNLSLLLAFHKQVDMQ